MALSYSWSWRKCFPLFTVDYVSCRFAIYSLNYAEVCSLYAHSLENFYYKWVLNFVNSFFFCIYWDDYMVFILQFADAVYHSDLKILNLCISGINPTWSWHMTFLMYCWITFASFLLMAFTSMFINDIGLPVIFFSLSLSFFKCGIFACF